MMHRVRYFSEKAIHVLDGESEESTSERNQTPLDTKIITGSPSKAWIAFQQTGCLPGMVGIAARTGKIERLRMRVLPRDIGSDVVPREPSNSPHPG